MSMSQKEILKEAREHPELVRRYGIGIAVQIARDHAKRPKTTTKDGKRKYQRNYMQIRRQTKKGQAQVPSLSDVLGLDMKRKR